MDASVEIQIQGGRSFTLDVGFADSVLEIKQKIQETQNIAVSRQTLMFHDQVLNDEQIIYDELAQDARLTLIVAFVFPPPQTPRKLKVKVEALSGAKMTVKVNRKDPVQELRVKIEESNVFPIPENGYFFIHRQSVMYDDRTFEWHGVVDGDKIEVFPGKVEVVHNEM